MNSDTVLYLGREALFTVILASAPILGASLLVGVLISIFQASTQIQEQTLTFVPKIVAVLVIIVLFGSWMGNVVLSFTSGLMVNLHQFISLK
ncbi:MAG: flagellar biosynthesis protein FliQ [Bacillota bacterium]